MHHRLDALDVDFRYLLDISDNAVELALEKIFLLAGEFEPREFGRICNVYFHFLLQDGVIHLPGALNICRGLSPPSEAPSVSTTKSLPPLVAAT